jgi:hypothetical protein
VAAVRNSNNSNGRTSRVFIESKRFAFMLLILKLIISFCIISYLINSRLKTQDSRLQRVKVNGPVTAAPAAGAWTVLKTSGFIVHLIYIKVSVSCYSSGKSYPDFLIKGPYRGVFTYPTTG